MAVPLTNTANLHIEAANLLGLVGRLFEAELNGNDTDRAIIKNHIRQSIAHITRWQACTLDLVPLNVTLATPEAMNVEAA